MPFDPPVFAARRKRLLASLGDDVAVLRTAPEAVRNRDSHYPYRYDSYFYYLSGFTEPEAALVLIGGVQPKSILLCRARDPERELWDGKRYGPELAAAAFGFDEAYVIDELAERLPGWLDGRARLHYAIGADAGLDSLLVGILNDMRANVRSGIKAPGAIHDIRILLDEMRLIKDAHELGMMRQAAQISAAAHRRAMQVARPGLHEYDIAAELNYVFSRGGSQAPAYTPIVAGGANACILHYVENRARLKDGDLLLIDAACELDGYASDITRTFPVNGRFSAAQRAVYDVVLDAQHAAIAEVKPGNSWQAPHDAAVKELAQGLIDLKLCTGSVDGVIESGDYKRFYMHRTGHWLGLDVHDAGEYKRDGEWRALEPGMTLTVEPGLYIRPGDGVPTEFNDIGIRIEDDVAVTPDGSEVLSAAAPKDTAEIEALMRDARAA